MTPPFLANAESLIADANRWMADRVAAEAAKSLACDRLSEGHMLAVEGHLRALVTGFGEAWTADYVQALADDLSDAAADQRAWDNLPEAGLRRRVPNMRERVEEAVAE